MDDKELHEEMRRRSQIYNLGCAIEELKAVIGLEVLRCLNVILSGVATVLRNLSYRLK